MATKNRAERQARMAVAENPATVKPPTRDELYAQAKEAGLAVTSRMKRDEIETLLSAHTGAQERMTVKPGDVTVTPPDPSTVAGRQALGDQRVAEAAAHYTETMADPNAPKPEEDPAKRTIAAKKEQAALKEWQLGGGKGKRPDTPNYDYIAATFVNGGATPKAKRKGAGRSAAAPKAKDGGPRGVEAEQAKEACGGKRENVVKISDDDLRGYIARVHAEHPESSRKDEREVAFWIEQFALNGRWPKLWKEVVVDGDAPSTPDPEPEPDEKLAAQVPAAVKAAAKKATASKKATPAKKATGTKKAAAKEVTPRFKSTAKK